MKEKINYCVKTNKSDISAFFTSYNLAFRFCLKIKGALYKEINGVETLMIDMK